MSQSAKIVEFSIKVSSDSEKSYWIKLHKNNQYIPYEHSNVQLSDPISTKTPPQPVDPNEWQLVQSKRKTLKINKIKVEPIYYWVVEQHNLFNVSDKSLKLFFTDIDMTQIENIDQNNYMALDKNNQLRLIHIHLRHKGMKMTPTYFVARNPKQIEDALQYVKYCVVKTENNAQKLIDLV